MADVEKQIKSEMKAFRKKAKSEIFGNPDEPIKKKVPRLGQWQDYLKVCLAKVDANQEGSPFAIEQLTGKKISKEGGRVVVNDVMKQCGELWHDKYRDRTNPRQAFTEDLRREQNIECEEGECVE